MDNITIEAPSVAAFAHALTALDHETRANVTATEHGTPWARVDVSPMTDTTRAVFPTDGDGFRGDDRKRGQAGVMLTPSNAATALPVVVNRARRMFGAHA